jgi:hypothetical protein
MNAIKKSVLAKLLVAFLVALGIQSSPAYAAQVDYFDVTPYEIIAGNAVIVSLQISDCSVAPTDLVLQVENAGTTVNLRMNSSDFEGKLINNAYLATWQYRGIKNRGAKVGEFSATVTGSSGCATELGPEIASNDESYVYPKTQSFDRLEIRSSNAFPSLDGIKVYWSKAIDAVKYKVQYAESGSENWQSAGFTTSTYMLLRNGIEVDFNKMYDIRVKAFDRKNNSVDTPDMDGETAAVSRAHSWTSEIGDRDRTEKTVFSSSSDIQFNLEIENCLDPYGYEDGSSFVGEVWAGSLTAGREWSGFSINEFGSAGIFTDYTYEYSDSKVSVSWQLDADLDPGFYTQGQYLMGCAQDNWTVLNEYPFSDYTQFTISAGGLVSPPDADSVSTAHVENAKSIEFKWSAPSNSGDGPFTYKIYSYINYDDGDSWKLIKTTKKKSFTYAGLRPAWEYDLAVEVSNAGGTSVFTLDGYTLPAMAKINSTFSNAQVANLLGIPKPSKAKFKMTLRNFKFVKSTCSIKKKKLVFSKNIGLCQMSATWKENGQSNSNEIYIWSHK